MKQWSAMASLCCLLAARSEGADAEVTLRILALDRPQAVVEQKLADAAFTPRTGIKVVLESRPISQLEERLDNVVAQKDPSYDLVHYENGWLGKLVTSGALQRLDTVAFLGTNDAAVVTNEFTAADLLATATNASLSLSVFRPEVVFRLGKYPTIERALYERKFDRFLDTPVYGLPWSTTAEILAYRVDLVEGSFARVQPSIAEFYNTQVAPQWTNEWRSFVSAARLVQLVNPHVQGVAVRAGPSRDAILQDFLPILWAFGGELWDESRRTAARILNGRSNVKALGYYSEWNLIKKIAPTNSVSWTNAEALRAMSDGQVAMGQFWPHLVLPLQTDKQSSIVGRLGFAMLPGDLAVIVQAKPSSGPNGAVTGALDAFRAETRIRRATLSGCVGVGISAFSRQKKAAWKYLEWLLSRQTQTALIFEAGSCFVSARRDLGVESGSATAVNHAVVDSFDHGAVRSSWNLPEAGQLDAVLARECHLAFRGTKSPQEALDTAAGEIQAILDETGGK